MLTACRRARSGCQDLICLVEGDKLSTWSRCCKAVCKQAMLQAARAAGEPVTVVCVCCSAAVHAQCFHSSVVQRCIPGLFETCICHTCGHSLGSVWRGVARVDEDNGDQREDRQDAPDRRGPGLLLGCRTTAADVLAYTLQIGARAPASPHLSTWRACSGGVRAETMQARHPYSPAPGS